MNRDTNRMATGGVLRGAIVAANAVAALGSGGFAVAALVDPELLFPDGQEATPAAEYYARLFAARSLPISAAALALTLPRSNNWLGVFPILAGLVQAADALIGVSYRNRAQTLAPAAAAAVHLASARWLLGDHPRPWRD